MTHAQSVRQDNPELRRRTVRRVIRRLAPFLILLYFINYLDRSNISFAGPNGMNADLKLDGTQFGLASGLFFIGYLLLEVPSNLALHKFGARRWIARIMVSWGIVATLMTLVSNAAWLYTVRILLGVAEAGFFPGIILYLTLWFPKRERAWAVGLFLMAVPLSSAIGSPLSAWLIQIGHGQLLGMEGWRFMFLIEGIPAVLLGIWCWFFLTDRPAQAKWLQPDEREWLEAEMAYEQAQTSKRYHYPLRKSLTNARIWALALVYFGSVYGLYAMSFFLPTIVKDFQAQFNTQFGLLERGLITGIPWAVAAVVMPFWSRHADRTGERVWHVAGPMIVGGIAIPIALYMNSPTTAMIAVTVCCVGICCALPTFWSLPTAFLSGAAAAGGIALINSVGNSAGFFAPYLTGWFADLTGSQKTGMWVIGAVMVITAFLAVALKATPPPDDATIADTDTKFLAGH